MVNENNSAQAKLFTSSLDNRRSNQYLFRTSDIKEYMEQQKEMNQTLSASILKMNHQMHDTKLEHMNHFNQFISKHEDSNLKLQNRLGEQEQTSQFILERIYHVEQLSQELRKKMNNDELMSQVIFDGLNAQDQTTQELSKHIKANDQTLEFIHQQLVSQEDLCKTLSEKLEIQEAFHQTLMERLDSQEALTQKISRQLEYLKGVIFERFSFLTDKIENSFKFTTGFFRSKSDTDYIEHNEEETKEEITKQ
ncbi:hypothetical protein [Bacillus sp. AK128]